MDEGGDAEFDGSPAMSGSIVYFINQMEETRVNRAPGTHPTTKKVAHGGRRLPRRAAPVYCSICSIVWKVEPFWR